MRSTEVSDDGGALAELAQLGAQLSRINIAGIHSSHRDSILPQYPTGLRLVLTRKYVNTASAVRQVLTGETRRKALIEGRGADSWAQANLDLTADHHRLKDWKAHLAWSDGAIRDMARQCADICATITRNRPHEIAHKAVGHYCAHHGIRMPEPTRGKTLAGCVARLCEPKWWRRAIRSTYGRRSEEIERELGLVSQRTGLYASDDSVARRREQKVRNRDLLESVYAVNDLGECFSLAQLSDVNVSNPKIRRAELMTRIAGFDAYAQAAGHHGHFISVTTPSRFHCVLQASGARNSKFDGSTVAEGQRFLRKQWARLRSVLRHRGLTVYGFRIAEPHHDGTPHWHLLLFTEPASSDAVIDAFKKYFDPDDEREPGSDVRRVDVVPIDSKKGSAAGYVAKYVSKNIDGFGVGDDAEATGATRAATDTARRVDAWASTSGIRQFQQIGGPPVSIWREVRRLRSPCKGLIEDVRVATEDQDWKRFWELLGGHQCRTGDRPVQLHTAPGSKPGCYGELIERQIKGVRTGALIVPTRHRTWTFVRSANSGSPWTRVNNCTGTGASTRATGTEADLEPSRQVWTLASDHASEHASGLVAHACGTGPDASRNHLETCIHCELVSRPPDVRTTLPITPSRWRTHPS
jgi:hypothetical protein